CQLIYPTISPINLSLTPELKQGFKTLLSQNNHQKNKFISFYFQGTDIPGKLETAVSLAGEIQVPLITVNLSLIIENKHNFRSTLQLILREAWFQKAVLYLDGLDSLYGEEQVIYYQYLIEAIAPEFGKKLDYTLAPSLFKGGWGGE
ncbi:MAG TPA: hypothetical protein DEG17_12305, partial [Cyanobacteria bacterium UBA11149]|nr:hypothetical protein [Cyanobacteria bacterium UBA11149]